MAAQVKDSFGKLRREALQLLDLNEASFGPDFDELIELASIQCGAPLSAVTLLDDSLLFVKASRGIGTSTMPLTDSVCQYTVQQEGVYVIEDLQADSRFASNTSMVHCDNGIRFYAGTPITTTNGTPIGALCVMDTVPAVMGAAQIRALELLGRQVSSRLQLRERAEGVAMISIERERARTLLATVLDSIPMEVYLKDTAGVIQFYNQQVANRFHITQQEWLGKTSFDLWDRQTAQNIRSEEEYVLQTGQAHDSYVDLPDSDGGISHWKTIKVPCQNALGDRLLVGVSIDMTQQMQREAEMQRLQDDLEEANRKLTSLALTDALTGLWNRRAFDARLETNIMASHRTRQPMVLMLIDIDHFKSVNDRHGHPYGDSVLRGVAALLNRCKRVDDVACRFGGEEFAILLPASDLSGGLVLGRRILDAFHEQAWEKEAVTTSIGIAVCGPECTSDELVDAADAALYKAKREGRDCMVVAEE